MKKITKDQIKELATKALASGNPYIKDSIKFFVDGQPRYIFADEVHTKEELDNVYLNTAMKDVKNGYNERAVGYYDKWYRYSRADEGRAYDLGVKLAASTAGCTEEMNIIPCIH